MATNKVGAGSTLFIPNKASPDPPTAASYGVDARTTEEWAQQTLGTIGGIQAAILEIEADINTINSEITVIDGTVATQGTYITTLQTEVTNLNETTGDLTADFQVGSAPPAGTRLTEAYRSRSGTATLGAVGITITGFSYGYMVVAFSGDVSKADSIAFIPGLSTLTSLQFFAQLAGSPVTSGPVVVNYVIVGA